ncbi:conserved hypothetical protein [Talaromyces stipitatus ATCC 10500]|uniref:N-acetyltransferase domain-containing protein n=1 Tax=Talaromyces stipitatus (strain ATCC 10500 / CBS 375.48 / QM 6759 / NRRL 1006) TaxID=441959 RepID=B8MLV8_TALSN|nr:uncharacterized protein TSTA_101240 [Talaromyces stipitatus ATCC 10500]EED13884.1 conserved hypothetical protein [Talaromyces stipitatus ATCC 10500]
MPLRPYKPTDSLSLATIKAQCDLTDPLALYCRNLDANQVQLSQSGGDDDKQWKAHIKSLQRSFELEILFPGSVCWVILQHSDQHDEDGSEKIVGFAIWNRHGHSSAAQKWKANGQRFSNRLKGILSYTTMTLSYPFDRSINHTNMTKFHHRIHSCPSPLPANHKLPRERWELEALYIAPSHQRQGYGIEALSWGINVAKEERVEIWVWSSDSGRRLYEKGGFEVLGRIGFGDLLDNSITQDSEVGVWVMVWRDRK